MALSENPRVTVFVGGVGGAKLALGLARIIPPENLTIIVNTGDDFWHYSLRITPDIDTVLYTLSGRVDPVNGWGLNGDTTQMLDTLRDYGETGWFRLGDKDIATHILRTHLLRNGQTLTQVIEHLACSMGIGATILPMTDDEVATKVMTEEYGELDFQEYFVKHRWQPTVTALRFAGAESARMTSAVIKAIDTADVILIGPSNPWLSISPIMSVPGLRDRVVSRDVPRVAITPIVDGQAIKGPAAKLMAELGYPVSADAVAEYYTDLVNGFIFDELDREKTASSHLHNGYFDTMMKTEADKIRLAQSVLSWIKGW